MTGTGRASDTTPMHQADLTAGPERAHASSIVSTYQRAQTPARCGWRAGVSIPFLLDAKNVSLYVRSASSRRDDVIWSENGCAAFRFA